MQLYLPQNQQRKIWKPDVTCDYCKKTVSIKSSIKVLERKNSKLTGKSFNLCPYCYMKFFTTEVKNVTVDVSGKKVSSDEKSDLIKWCKNLQ